MRLQDEPTQMLLRALTALAAPGGCRGRLLVFYFHRVLERPDPLLSDEPCAKAFDQILSWIDAQFRVLDPLEACDRLYDGSLPSRAAAITFDDGYRDNFEVALPILQAHGMSAAFFVSTGFLDGGLMFNDRVIEAIRRTDRPIVDVPGRDTRIPIRSIQERRSAIDAILETIKHLDPVDREAKVNELEANLGSASRGNLMMTPDHVAGLHRAGMRVGGHTRTHPILVSLDDLSAEREIKGGLDDLQAIIGERPELFAYPNGKSILDFDNRHVAMVEQAGCTYAFTTEAASARITDGAHLLPRFTPWARRRVRFGLQALGGLIL